MNTDSNIPLYHAKRELRSAEKAIERMQKAETLEDFEDEWKVYLNSIEKVWVKTERACQHVRNKFQPWQGSFASERKKDPLLKYLKHARNSDQHTIAESMTRQKAERSISIEGKPSGGIKIDKLVIKDGRIEEYRGDSSLIIKNLPERIELLKVKDSNKWYNPPKSHKGKKLPWPAPVAVAILGVNYYGDFLFKVEEKFF